MTKLHVTQKSTYVYKKSGTGAIINCLHNGPIPENVINSYCYIMGTFSVPAHFVDFDTQVKASMFCLTNYYFVQFIKEYNLFNCKIYFWKDKDNYQCYCHSQIQIMFSFIKSTNTFKIGFLIGIIEKQEVNVMEHPITSELT